MYIYIYYYIYNHHYDDFLMKSTMANPSLPVFRIGYPQPREAVSTAPCAWQRPPTARC